MRQAINNLQSTWSGFGFVSQDNVFKICDQPHPVLVRSMIKHCQKAEIDEALARIDGLWEQGYSAVDIVTTIFRVVKGMEELPEYTKLEYIRVSRVLGAVVGSRTCSVVDERVRAALTRRRSAGRICAYSRAWERASSSAR